MGGEASLSASALQGFRQALTTLMGLGLLHKINGAYASCGDLGNYQY